MATSSCSPVTFVDTCSDAFYFNVEAAATDVVDDSFNMSRCCLGFWVRSTQNKFLLLNGQRQFQVQNLTTEQLRQPGCQFKIQVYNDFERLVGEERKRKAVMLYVKNHGRNMVVCCRQEAQIYPEEMEPLPTRINGTKHKALFFMTELTASHMYEFESSEYPTMFLGFQPDGENSSLNKLVLRGKPKEDEPDVSCQVMLCNY